MKTAFISHSFTSSRSFHLADALTERLRSIGVETFSTDSLSHQTDPPKSVTELIDRSQVFISIYDSGNPNLMFELGYAFAKSKTIIIIGDDFREVPFDLRSNIFLPRTAPDEHIAQEVEFRVAEHSEPSVLFDVEHDNPSEIIRLLQERPEYLEQISGLQFETVISRRFEQFGCLVRRETSRRDLGYDFSAEPFRGVRAAVEVKKYKSSSQISISVIRQLIGAMALEGIEVGIIVSTAPFTKSALSFAEEIEPKVLLWTFEEFAEMEKLGK